MIATVLIVIVALLHTYFLVLEMFLWTTPRVRKIFGQTAEQAEITKVLAAGLLWGLTLGLGGNAVTTFFLLCVFIAGLYGAATANPRILLFQSLPAALALGATALGL